eukprot:scaffold23.g4088.t1
MASSMLRNVKRRGGGGHTFQISVVAQHCTDLPLSAGARARFVLKRRGRITVTDAEEVDGSGAVEWNTVCTQTATLRKEGAGWRRKEFVLKVQALKGGGGPGPACDEFVTIAKLALDLAPFCGAEALGPHQLTFQLQPAGRLTAWVATEWLQHYDRERDQLTDMSYLSLEQSCATTSNQQAAGSEQDLSGFEAAAGALGGAGAGPIRAVYVQQQEQEASAGSAPGSLQRSPFSLRAEGRAEAAQQQEAAGASPRGGSGVPRSKRSLSGVRAALLGGGGGGGPGGAAGGRPPRWASGRPGAQQQQQGTAVPAVSAAGSSQEEAPGAGPSSEALQQQQEEGGEPLQRSATAPALGQLASRRPPGATQLQVGGWDAAGKAQAQVQLQQQVAQGLPPDQWSPIDVREAVAQLYDSEEEATPRPGVVGTVKRWFTATKARGATPPGSSTAKQLHSAFGFPSPLARPTSPNPAALASIDRETSLGALRRRCKALLAERDDARAAEYSEASLAIQLQSEVDKLRREKRDMLARLQTTEAQLLATFRDEATSDIIQELAKARVEAAQREFQLMEAQGQLRARDAAIDRLRQRLTRLETQYRSSVNALTPGSQAGTAANSPSPWGPRCGGLGADGEGEGDSADDAPVQTQSCRLRPIGNLLAGQAGPGTGLPAMPIGAACHAE